MGTLLKRFERKPDPRISLVNFMFDNFTKISFIFLISVGDRFILMFPPVFFI